MTTPKTAQAVLNLPDNEATFAIDVEGETTGNHYTGSFTVICVPNQRQKAAANVEEATMRRNTEPTVLDANTVYFIKCIAQLQFRVTKCPQWWQDAQMGRDLYDLKPIFEVMEKAIEAETKWREKACADKKPAAPAFDQPNEVAVDDTLPTTDQK